MKPKHAICTALLVLLTGVSGFAGAPRPNIVLILADDLGNADLGYRGSKIRTPNIDALAKGGVRLESYYGLPVCTPARAALMTGRYPMRHGLQTLVIFPSHKYGLPTEEKTLPQALKEVGYRTAIVGKWHLGHADKKYWPQNRGFDHFYGNLIGEVDYFTKDRGGVTDWQRNGKFFKEEGYYMDLIGKEAVSLIQNHDTSQPFFLYFASLSAHAPYQAPRRRSTPTRTSSRTRCTAPTPRWSPTWTGRWAGSSPPWSRRGCARTRSSSSRRTTAARPVRCLPRAPVAGGA